MINFRKNTVYINFRRADKFIIQPSSGALAPQGQIILLEKPEVFRKAKSETLNNFST